MQNKSKNKAQEISPIFAGNEEIAFRDYLVVYDLILQDIERTNPSKTHDFEDALQDTFIRVLQKKSELKEFDKCLSQLLRDFSSEEEEIATLHFQGSSTQKISETLKMPPERVIRQKNRILAKIRGRLKSLFDSSVNRSPFKAGKNNEALLVEKINSILPTEKRKRYDELYTKFQQDKLTSKEYSELKKLGDEFEILNAKRLKYIGELADLRGTPFKETVQEFKN